MTRLLFFLLVTPLINGLADEPEPEWGHWAAIAHAGRTEKIGRAFSERSEFLAKEGAIRACRDERCEIKAYVERGCIGWARGWDAHVPQQMWFGFGASVYEARVGESVRESKRQTMYRAGELARRACEDASKSECTVMETFCTWDKSGLGTEDEVGGWLTEFGGDFSPGVQNTLRLVNVSPQHQFLNLGLSYEIAACLASRPRWPSVRRFALFCGLGARDLDRLYAAANR